MIQIEEKLKVTAEEFFERITASVIYDIEQSADKKIKPEDIYEGYVYKKGMKNKVGRKGDVEVEIVKYAPPCRYRVEFHSVGGDNYVDYEITGDGEDGILVKYEENYDGNTKSQNLNYKIIGALYRKKAKKRAAYMLHAMEDYIRENRKNLSGTP